ncbi:MAG TPA: CHAD domain-containing protein [Alphaproteobacteria bacterium]|nr:CHAD domain-containing protein [Alphaproteobacteria bacterium]
MPNSTPAAPRGPAPANDEVEIKLLVAPEDVERLLAHPRFAEAEAKVKPQRDVYYDTPDLDLLARGVALRLRRSGEAFIQTVKTLDAAEGAGAAGATVRKEWEWPVAGDALDLGKLGGPGVRDYVPKEVREALRPIFETDIRRTVLTLKVGRGAIEAAVDVGAVRAGGAEHRVSEMELELKGAPVPALYDLALELHRAVPLQLSSGTKAAAGYGLATGRKVQARKAATMVLTPAMTVADAFRHVVRACLSHLVANQGALLAGDTVDGIHQMRVAVRRLRSAFGLFRPFIADDESARLREELKWLAGALGPARDWDVFVTQILPRSEDYEAPAEARAALAEAAEAVRAAANVAALEAIRSPRYTDLLLTLGGWLEGGRWHQRADRGAPVNGPIHEAARTSLAKGFKRVKRGGRKLDWEDAEPRHELRKDLKKFRYAVDFFKRLFPQDRVEPYLGALESLQDDMGELNDYAVAQHLFAELRNRAPAAGPAATALAARFAKREKKRVKDLPKAWRRFMDADPFWC